MAQMIPDSIPSKSSQGERTLYSLLRDGLPDDFTVWYEPQVDGLLPDFVILNPSFGLLVIEVKGWYANSIEKADSHFFQIRWKRDGQEKIESQTAPLRQAHGYVSAVMNKLLSYPILCHPDGDFEGKLAFPVGCGAVMSNISASQARDNHLLPLLEAPFVAFRNELIDWQQFSDRQLIQRLKEMFRVNFGFLALAEDQINTIKGVLHPEVAIREVPATPSSLPAELPLQKKQQLPDNSTILISLDLEQEKLARSLKGGHRLFYGVAGSGKTLILLSRAKALINNNPEQRILVLCYNIALASHLRSLLHHDERHPQYQKIEVKHFHAWAHSLGVRGKIKEEDRLGEKLLGILETLPLKNRWDAILIDEAHTFAPSWLQCCVTALKDPENGDLMVVSDGSQQLYQRRNFTWKSVGINAVGRSKRLDQNYRNTQEILTLAWDMVQPLTEIEDLDPDETFPIVEPAQSLRTGKQPVMVYTQSKSDAVSALIAQTESLIQSGYCASDIAVIYRWLQPKGLYYQIKELTETLESKGIGAYWITENQESKQNYVTQCPGVRIVTALSSLGLEFKVVLLLWVEHFWDAYAKQPEKRVLARRQCYVAMTRAQEELYLFGSGESKFIQELRDNDSLILTGYT